MLALGALGVVLGQSWVLLGLVSGSLCASGLQEVVYKWYSIRSNTTCGLEVLQAAEDLSAAANYGWSPKRWSRPKTFDSSINIGEV